MKELIYSLKHLYRKKELYSAIMGILLINLVHIFLVIYHNNYNLHLFCEIGYKAEYLFILYNLDVNINLVIIIALPILCSTIFSDINWLENNKKITNILYSRLNKKTLIFVRFFLILITTFVIVFCGFMLNYYVLAKIYGSGNALTYFQSPGFYLSSNKYYFIDNLRLISPFWFIVSISAHTSFLISLLSSLSYAISFFIKQRIIIYVFPFLALIGDELILSIFKLDKYSIIGQLQPFSSFSIYNAILLYVTLLLSCIVLLLLQIRKKDYL